MKAYFTWISLAAGAASLVVTTGCRGISITHTQDICGLRFAPSDPAHVEILPNVPARPYVEVGQVWAYSPNASGDASKMEDALRTEAAKIGADAFVVWRDGIQAGDPTLSSVEDGHLVNKPPGRTVIGVAIKYP